MPSTSSTAFCSPGTRNDSCHVPKPGPRSGWASHSSEGKGSKLSKCRVYSRKGRAPRPWHATARTAEDPHAHCTAIHLCSLRPPRGSRADLSIPKHCASTHCPVAVSPFPQVTFLPVSPPSPKSCRAEGRGWLVLSEAVAHCIPPVPATWAGAYAAPDCCGTCATLCHAALPALMPSLCYGPC